jgi:hypothetical protein
VSVDRSFPLASVKRSAFASSHFIAAASRFGSFFPFSFYACVHWL